MSNEIVIDFSKLLLVEQPGRVYTEFTDQVSKLLLGLMYSGIDIPLKVRGSQNQVESFFQALRGEKRYMDSYNKHGLNDPITLKRRSKLMDAVKKFESETRLRWPFK